jgi:hypothetical protein
VQSRKQIVIEMLACAVACVWILLVPSPVATAAGATTDGVSPVVVREIRLIPAAVREIVDPANGDRWLLVRDSATPGGPGRLIRVPKTTETGSVMDARQSDSGAFGAVSTYRPVIHSGDSLVIEQSSPVLEARFAAVALETAPAGARFRARLQATGAVVHAIAIASGRAALAEETGGSR